MHNERGDLIRKEIASPVRPSLTDRNDKLLSLTSRPFHPKLGIEGDIFMAELGQIEISKRNVSKPYGILEAKPKPLTPERAEVEGRWERDYLRGRKLSSLPFDEQQTVRAAIKAGAVPVPVGGAEEGWPEGDPLINITDESLQRQFGIRARDIIGEIRAREPRLNREEYIILYGEIQRSIPSSDTTLEQRAQFNFQKRDLLGIISGEVKRVLRQGRERGETGIKAIEFVAKIKNPDQDKDVYDVIDETIDNENANDQSYGEFIEATVERLMADKVDSNTIEYLLEYSTERILKRADVSPKGPYPQFGFYENINLDSIIAMSRIYDHSLHRTEGAEGTSFKYLSDLRERRHIMHELFRNMKDRRTYVSYITQNLRKEGLAFVEKQIAGVADSQIIYEKFLGSALSLKRGWLTSDDIEGVDRDVEGFMTRNAAQFSKEIKDENGNVIDSRPLRPWELKRAAIVGKSLNAAMQRRLVYTVMGDVPTHDITTLLDSVDSEELARILAPMKLITERFLGIDTNTRKIFIEEVLRKTKELAKARDQTFGYESTDKNGNRITQGLYGKRENSWAILDTGITDPKSNGWRGVKIFLDQKDYRTETLDSKALSIWYYLDRIKGEERDAIEGVLKSRYPNKNQREIDNIIASPEYDDRLTAKFNYRVRDVIQKQRLFLGPLLQMGNLNEGNKRMVWEKVSELLPSRIAAFFPEETLDIVRRAYNLPQGKRDQVLGAWDRFKTKLFLAESKRVADDAENIKGKTWGEIGALKNLSDYYQDAGIGQPPMGLGEQDPEIRIIRELTELGKEKAPELAKIKFPYTPFLDDVPKTDWENIEDFSYDRILVRDHSDFQEGYNEIIGLMGKPITSPQQVIEAFAKASLKIQGPLGLKASTGGAQGVMEKYIDAYLSMAREFDLAKYLGPLMKLVRIPKSEMEVGNLQANIAINEVFTAQVLDGLAQQDVISDDPAEKDKNGLTQTMRMKKENKADMKWKLYYWIRLIAMLLGPIAAFEIARTLLPREAAEQVLAGF